MPSIDESVGHKCFAFLFGYTTHFKEEPLVLKSFSKQNLWFLLVLVHGREAISHDKALDPACNQNSCTNFNYCLGLYTNLIV